MDKKAMFTDFRFNMYPITPAAMTTTMKPMIKIHGLFGHLIHFPPIR